MDFIVIAYVGVLALGILWVLYRANMFLRSQKERDRRWAGEISPDEFAAFMEDFKRNQAKKEAGQDPGLRNRVQESSPNGLEPSSTGSVTPVDRE
jgi:hypothetical protein